MSRISNLTLGALAAASTTALASPQGGANVTAPDYCAGVFPQVANGAPPAPQGEASASIALPPEARAQQKSLHPPSRPHHGSAVSSPSLIPR